MTTPTPSPPSTHTPAPAPEYPRPSDPGFLPSDPETGAMAEAEDVAMHEDGSSDFDPQPQRKTTRRADADVDSDTDSELSVVLIPKPPQPKASKVRDPYAGLPHIAPHARFHDVYKRPEPRPLLRPPSPKSTPQPTKPTDAEPVRIPLPDYEACEQCKERGIDCWIWWVEGYRVGRCMNCEGECELWTREPGIRKLIDEFLDLYIEFLIKEEEEEMRPLRQKAREAMEEMDKMPVYNP